MYVLRGCVCNVCVCVSEGMCVFKCIYGGQKTTWMLVPTFHFESYSTGLAGPQIQGFSCLCLPLSWRSCCYRYIWLSWVLGTPTRLLRLLVCNSLSSIVSHKTSKLFSRRAVSVWLCFPNCRSDTNTSPLSHNAPWQTWKSGLLSFWYLRAENTSFRLLTSGARAYRVLLPFEILDHSSPCL